MESIIVVGIVVVVALIGLRGFIRTAKGQGGGCGGSCACSSEKKQTCGNGNHQNVEIMDLRQK